MGRVVEARAVSVVAPKRRSFISKNPSTNLRVYPEPKGTMIAERYVAVTVH